MSIKSNYIILTSAVGLGSYVPALILKRQLNSSFYTHFFIFENLFNADKKDKILLNKQTFHQNLRVALKAINFSSNLSSSIDQNSVARLFSEWDLYEELNVVLFSGFWLPIVEKYLSSKGNNRIKNIYLCHMDAVVSPSWQSCDINNPLYKNVWLFNWNDSKVYCSFLNIRGIDLIPYENRPKKLLLHGGGWGIGTYKNKIDPLTNNGFFLDIIAYEKEDIGDFINKKYFMIDPKWKCWEKDANNDYSFPPFGEVKDRVNISYSSNYLYPNVYDHICNSLAIVSKPGGGTLIDSLLTATPLVYLEGYGSYEEKNGLLWKELGAGISYEEWEREHFNLDILKKIHERLLHLRKETKDILHELTYSI